MPIVVIEGLVQSRDSSEPRADGLHPVQQAGVGAQLLLGEVQVGGLARPAGPATATSPSASCSEASVRTRAVMASGTAPPNMPLWMPWSRARTVSDDADHPAQGRGQRRLPDRPVGRVGQHDGVGAQLLAVPLEDRREAVGADLLLALDEDGDPDRQLAAVRAQGGDVGHDPGLVVGDAAGVDPAVPLGRLERRAVPVRRRRRAAARRGGRRAGRWARPVGPVDVPDDGRAAALADDLDARPSARSSSATAVALASTWPWSNASSDTLGMRVRVSRSARMSGIRACTRCCRAASRSGARMSSVTPASVPTASAGPRPVRPGGPRPVRRDLRDAHDRCATTYSVDRVRTQEGRTSPP